MQFAPSLGANCTRLSPDETRSEHSNHPLGLISDLQMSEPDDVQVVHQRDLIPFAVAFECCDPGMESPTVELDDQPPLRIPEVDPTSTGLDPVERHLPSGKIDPVPLEEADELRFELGLGRWFRIQTTEHRACSGDPRPAAPCELAEHRFDAGHRRAAINDLVHGVHLLSGHFGKPGDAPTSLTGQPSACGTVREVGTLSHALPGGLVVANPEHRRHAEEIWNLPEGRINATPGAHTVEMWRRFSTAASEGGDIDTIWVQVTNPAQSLPNTKALFEPSRSIPGKFLIVSDVYPTATARAADLILPSAMWVEKNGMVGNSERRTQQWFKMVNPPGEARDDAWQVIAVARKLFDRGHLGMRDKDGRFLFHMTDATGAEVPVWDFRRYYDVNVDQQLFDEYRRFSRFKHKDLAPYAEYTRARGLRWPVVERDGVWEETRYRFVEGEDPYVEAGKGIQFYHSTSGDDRAQVWIQPYVAPPEEPDAEYPFWLCTGRVIEHWHTGSMTMRVPQLRRAMPEAYVELNATDARRLGVENGDVVRLETRRGAIEIAAWIDGRGRPPAGSLFVPFFDDTSWDGPAWSISAEWLAYLMFGLLVLVLFRVARATRARGLLWLAFIATLPPLVFLAATGAFYTPWSWLPRIVMQFTAGALACAAVRKLRLTRRGELAAGYLAVALVALMVGMLYWFDAHPIPSIRDDFGLVDVLFLPLVVALSVGAGSLPALLSTRVLVYGGQISFSLYMVHELVHQAWNWAGAQYQVDMQPSWSTKLVVLALLAGCFVGAALLFHFVEEPARHWMRRMVSPKSSGAKTDVTHRTLKPIPENDDTRSSRAG